MRVCICENKLEVQLCQSWLYSIGYRWGGINNKENIDITEYLDYYPVVIYLYPNSGLSEITHSNIDYFNEHFGDSEIVNWLKEIRCKKLKNVCS